MRVSCRPGQPTGRRRASEDLLLESWEGTQHVGRLTRRLRCNNEPRIGHKRRLTEGGAWVSGALATYRSDTLDYITVAHGTRARRSIEPSATAWQQNGNISTNSNRSELTEPYGWPA